MANLLDGVLLINDIEISINDSLTGQRSESREDNRRKENECK